MLTAKYPAQVQTTAQIDQAHAEAIANSLQQLQNLPNQPVPTEDITPASVTPVTAATPVPKSPHLEAIGAQVIGEDFSHILTTTIGDLTTGSTKTRITPSGRFLDTLKDKLIRKKQANENSS
jgi:hypothetical protein